MLQQLLVILNMDIVKNTAAGHLHLNKQAGMYSVLVFTYRKPLIGNIPVHVKQIRYERDLGWWPLCEHSDWEKIKSA